MKFKRIFTIVLDSVGVGELPDAAAYNDLGADTLGHIADSVNGLNLPHLASLGLGNLHSTQGVDPVSKPLANYGKLAEASLGKDTMTGHWEMMGLLIDEPFITFTDTGFPDELINELKERTGFGVIGNKSASGTEIIDEFGEQHMKTNEMIVYTSADSVLQIAAHEETFGLDNLIKACEIAREIMMKPEWKVGRIIARPFIGSKVGEFKRTSNRKDYALKPFEPTVLDTLKENGLDVIAIGKIVDIFDGEGITSYQKTKSNVDGMEKTIEIVKNKDFTGLCFVNLVDFDALWGHRRNPQGYAQELEVFDKQLGELLPHLKEDDLLILTSDHGNDPTHHGTDHTREYIFQIVYSPSLQGNQLLDVATTFASIGATIADNFGVDLPKHGRSYLKDYQ
ncbi:MAG: phosphopentomutase [Erysipelothrix sp.]|jgi:phosphopentomutase|nr:phosphopentomutase [Erysipelothrix sp.]